MPLSSTLPSLPIFTSEVEARPSRVASPRNSKGSTKTQSKGKVAEACCCVFGHDELVAVAKSTGLSPRWPRLQSVVPVSRDQSQTEVCATGGELRQMRPEDVLRRKMFLEIEGPVVCLRLALLVFVECGCERSATPLRICCPTNIS